VDMLASDLIVSLFVLVLWWGSGLYVVSVWL